MALLYPAPQPNNPLISWRSQLASASVQIARSLHAEERYGPRASECKKTAKGGMTNWTHGSVRPSSIVQCTHETDKWVPVVSDKLVLRGPEVPTDM
jgi:hypothetical protein